VAARSRRRVSPYDIAIRHAEVSSALNRQKSPKFAQMAVNMAVSAIRDNHPDVYVAIGIWNDGRAETTPYFV
jgi:hypothetical protein